MRVDKSTNIFKFVDEKIQYKMFHFRMNGELL